MRWTGIRYPQGGIKKEKENEDKIQITKDVFFLCNYDVEIGVIPIIIDTESTRGY